jgi:hypothetical protein
MAGQGTAALELIEEVGPAGRAAGLRGRRRADLGLRGGGARHLSPGVTRLGRRARGRQRRAAEPGARRDRAHRHAAHHRRRRADAAQRPADLPGHPALVSGILTVSDAQLVATMRFFAERMKMVVEPTGCLARRRCWKARSTCAASASASSCQRRQRRPGRLHPPAGKAGRPTGACMADDTSKPAASGGDSPTPPRSCAGRRQAAGAPAGTAASGSGLTPGRPHAGVRGMRRVHARDGAGLRRRAADPQAAVLATSYRLQGRHAAIGAAGVLRLQRRAGLGVDLAAPGRAGPQAGRGARRRFSCRAPPYQVVDNPLTWLEHFDLVFIDPPHTGWSVTASERRASACCRWTATSTRWPR